MTVAIDRVIKHSVVNYCRDNPVVHKTALETAVGADCRVRCGMTPSAGHVWAALKDLHRHDYVEGMFDGERFGVKRARHSVPRTTVRIEPKQDGFGFGENE